jgi:hypothetical protein
MTVNIDLYSENVQCFMDRLNDCKQTYIQTVSSALTDRMDDCKQTYIQTMSRALMDRLDDCTEFTLQTSCDKLHKEEKCSYCLHEEQSSSLLFWDVALLHLMTGYQCFETRQWSHLQGSKCIFFNDTMRILTLFQIIQLHTAKS